MAWTREDLVALDEAIKAGERTVRLPSGVSVTYRSASELIQLRSYVERKLIEQEQQRRRPRAVLMRPSKGI